MELSFLYAMLVSCDADVSIRSVSEASSRRFGLEAELSELERSVRVVGFSKLHCESCAEMSAILAGESEVPRCEESK